MILLSGEADSSVPRVYALKNKVGLSVVQTICYSVRRPKDLILWQDWCKLDNYASLEQTAVITKRRSLGNLNKSCYRSRSFGYLIG